VKTDAKEIQKNWRQDRQEAKKPRSQERQKSVFSLGALGGLGAVVFFFASVFIDIPRYSFFCQDFLTQRRRGAEKTTAEFMATDEDRLTQIKQ
jgi:hypothetical protein